MLVKYAETDEQQYDASHELWLQTFHDRLAEHHAQSISEKRHDKRTDTYNYKWDGQLLHVLIAKTRERDADGKSVDARCHGEKQLAAYIRRIEMLLFLIPE